MVVKENPTENIDEELSLVKVAAWAWYRHGLGLEQMKVFESNYMESSHSVVASTPSRYKMEAMKTPQDLLQRSMSSGDNIGSSLLDVYEIERISKDLDYYIESSCDEYYCCKSIDGVCDSSGGKKVLLLPERVTSGTKGKRRRKRKKWFRLIYEVCGLNKGDVVEGEKRNSTSRDVNSRRKATSK